MKRNRMYLVIALVAAVAALRATPVAAQAGPEQTQKFLKTVEGTVKAIGESRAQLQKTVATYNSITEMTAQGPQERLQGPQQGRRGQREEGGRRPPEGRRDEHRGRTATSPPGRRARQAISDPDLRKRSEERLADAQERFEKIAAAGKDTRQSFDTLMTDVKDQSTFLGHDLNASAIASLKPDAAKFNARATTVFAKVDDVTKMFDEYIASLKP